MNPLLFIPSPRNIPEVLESWENIPYDRFIVKNELEKPAYQIGRDFFLKHDEYTHLVICPDDIIINHDAFEILRRDVIYNNFNNLCGVAMVDETSNAYACKPLGVPFDAMSGGSYYYRPHKSNREGWKLLPKEITEVGYTGFMIQWLSRWLVKHLSFAGGCQDGEGCMDLKQSQEMKDMGIPYLIQPNAFFTHLRHAQYKETKEWIKNGDHTKGYTKYIQKRR